MWSTFRVTAWLAVIFCVFRGLPVIVHSLREYWGVPAQPKLSEPKFSPPPVRPVQNGILYSGGVTPFSRRYGTV